jgi:hypothetical protein
LFVILLIVSILATTNAVMKFLILVYVSVGSYSFVCNVLYARDPRETHILSTLQ